MARVDRSVFVKFLEERFTTHFSLKWGGGGGGLPAGVVENVIELPLLPGQLRHSPLFEVVEGGSVRWA